MAGPSRQSRLLAALAAVCLVFVAACSSREVERIDIRISDVTIRAEVARTVGERADGLSDRDSLPADAGMLFIEGDEDIPGFWMRGMRFPLDFIWISRDLRVADLRENVPVDEQTTNVADISPKVPVLYVLEVNAGFIEREGVHVGDVVTFDPDVSVR